MAGYSGTPLPKKLGIKENHKVVILGAPAGFDVGTLPMGAVTRKSLPAQGTLDVAVVFIKNKAELAGKIAEIRKKMASNAGLWIAWPKKASGVATDMTEDVIREVALPTGLVDNKVCAIDETWSGLRLVIRRENR